MIQHAPRYFALIPAAGVGARMAADGPKQYLPINGKPMLRHTIDAFLSSDLVTHTYVVVSALDGVIDSVVPAGGVTVLRCGGATRMDSVQNALQALEGTLRDTDWVLVHDAARPGLDAVLIERLIREVGADAVGGLLALPVVDTVKRAASRASAGARAVAGEGAAAGAGEGAAAGAGAAASEGASAGAAAVVTTVARDGLWLAQTPQMFRYRLLRDALAAATDAAAITDDASAVEAMGLSPKLVEGHPRNLKVTLPADIRIAEMYLAA